MKYEWEKNVSKRIEKIQAALPKHLRIVSVGVENTKTGEGALVDALEGVDHLDVTDADVRSDILGDAQRQYDAACEAVFRHKRIIN